LRLILRSHALDLGGELFKLLLLRDSMVFDVAIILAVTASKRKFRATPSEIPR
jgi:hypothetical protein